MQHFREILPELFEIESNLLTLADGAAHNSRLIDITDVISDPADPLGDFGPQPLGVTNTRAWVLAWAISLELPTMGAFAGTNRANLFLRIFDNVRGLILINQPSATTVRLYIPDTIAGTYAYTGSRIVHSKQAGIQVQNLTGDEVILELIIWAKAW